MDFYEIQRLMFGSALVGRLSAIPGSSLQQTNLDGCLVQTYEDPKHIMIAFDSLPKEARDFLNNTEHKLCAVCASLYYQVAEMQGGSGMFILQAMAEQVRIHERSKLRKERHQALIKEQQERIARSRGRI